MMKTEPRILAYALTLIGALNLACANTPVEGSATGTEGSSSGTDGSASAASNTTPTTTQGSASNSASATDSTVSGNSNSGMTEATTADLTTDGLTGTGPDTTDNTTGVVDTSDTGTTGASTSTTGPDTGTTGTGTTDASTSTTGASTGTTDASTSTTGDVIECGLQLKVTIRDFKLGHPDFQTYCCGVVKGLVKVDLGADKKPVFNQVGNPKMLTDAASFNQWYNNTKDVNDSIQIVLDLQEVQPGVYSYQNNSFFPIDNQLFGNEGNVHNFHFTTEIHTAFQYTGGETFTFTGDDDVWVFINKKLVIDIGGVHGNTAANVKLDDLGLTPGLTYPLDVFHAERHTTQSNFRIDTTICSVPQ